jgi:DNA-binding CsgD family transcriptional regulator
MDSTVAKNGGTGPLVGSAFDEEEIHQAIVGLPQRQREALDLLELERLSYAEIAARMATSEGSIAQLIARARINLYDELRGTPLASVAAPSPQCERSLPLIAAREDGQLDPADDEAAWLDAHLAGCDRCRPAVEQMADAAAAYRASAAPGPSTAAPATRPAVAGTAGPRRRTMVLVATSLAVVLLAGLAAAFVRDDGASAPADPATEVAAPATGGGEGSRQAKVADADGRKGKAGKKKSKPARGKAKTAAGQGATGKATAGEPTPTSVTDPMPPASGGGARSEDTSAPHRSSGQTAVRPPKQVSTPKPSSKPKPAPSSTQAFPPASAPAPEAPSSEASPPAEEAPDRPGRSGEAPGKPANRPSR